MDFLDPAKKRAHGIRLAIGYILLGLSIAVVSLILLFQSYGYDLDRHTGKIIQNGLVFVSAKPESASIKVNGKDEGSTDARLALPAGKYTLQLSRQGYRTWERTFNLEGGSLERLTYPLLIPQTLAPKDVELYSKLPGFTSASLDHHWIIVQKAGDLAHLEVFDTTHPDQDSNSISLPENILTKSSGPEDIKPVEWAADNRHLLVKHTYKGGTEFVMIDRQNPASSINVNKQLNRSPAAVTLFDGKYDQLYLFDAKSKVLAKANLKNKQVQSLLSGVISYKAYGSDDIAYISTQASKGSVALKLVHKNKQTILRNFKSDTAYMLDLASFGNSLYVAGGTYSSGIISIYKDPQNAPAGSGSQGITPVTALRINKPSAISFSAGNQFVAVQGGSRFAVYDMEKNRRYYYGISSAGDDIAKWIDESHMVIVSSGTSAIFDYDGVNVETLVSASPGYEPMFNHDFTSMYIISPSAEAKGRFALTRTSLKASQR